eukprot:TRINITY_DN32639_c0_g1_i1.p1 TRINITY_DN32639_c0_g1~~TRINITY_DN32639_c0_g1_i1.p1  ORF type:complete len:1027 (+),score=343.15 TRINITY_DN32639_c0_g1_i1:77-3157(+)
MSFLSVSRAAATAAQPALRGGARRAASSARRPRGAVPVVAQSGPSPCRAQRRGAAEAASPAAAAAASAEHEAAPGPLPRDHSGREHAPGAAQMRDHSGSAAAAGGADQGRAPPGAASKDGVLRLGEVRAAVVPPGDTAPYLLSQKATGLVAEAARAHADLEQSLGPSLENAAQMDLPVREAPAAAEEGAEQKEPAAADRPPAPLTEGDISERARLQLPWAETERLAKGLSDAPDSDLSLAAAAERLAVSAAAAPEGSPLLTAAERGNRHAAALSAVAGYSKHVGTARMVDLSDVRAALADSDRQLRRISREVGKLQKQCADAHDVDEDQAKEEELALQIDARRWAACKEHMAQFRAAREHLELKDEAAAQHRQAVQKALQEATADCSTLRSSVEGDIERLERAVASAEAEHTEALETAERHKAELGERIEANVKEQVETHKQIQALYAKLGQLSEAHGALCKDLEATDIWKARAGELHDDFIQKNKKYQELLVELAGKVELLSAIYEDTSEHVEKREERREAILEGTRKKIGELANQELREYWDAWCDYYVSCGTILFVHEELHQAGGPDGEGAAGAELVAELRGRMQLAHADPAFREAHEAARAARLRMGGEPPEDPEATLKARCDELRKEFDRARAAASEKEQMAAAKLAAEGGPKQAPALQFRDRRPRQGGDVRFWVAERRGWFRTSRQLMWAKGAGPGAAVTQVDVEVVPGAVKVKEPYDIMYLRLGGARVQLPGDGARRTIILWKLRALMRECGVRPSKGMLEVCETYNLLRSESEQALRITDLRGPKGKQDAAAALPSAHHLPKEFPAEAEPAAEADAAAEDAPLRVRPFGSRAFCFAAAAGLGGAAAPAVGAIVSGTPLPPTSLIVSAAGASYIVAPIWAVPCGVERAAQGGSLLLLRLMLTGALTAVVVPFAAAPGEGLYELATLGHVPDVDRAVAHGVSFLGQHGPQAAAGGAAAGAVLGSAALVSPGALIAAGGLCLAASSVAVLDAGARDAVLGALKREGPIGAMQVAVRSALAA